MKNKKGFTLTELLTVIAIISIISLIAIPNIINIVDNIKKDNMIDDAKRLISLAKLEVNSSYEYRNFLDTKNIPQSVTCTSDNCKFMYSYLNRGGDIKLDPDGGSYSDESYVKYYKSGNNPVYCVYLKSNTRTVGSVSGCINEENLSSNKVNPVATVTCSWKTTSSSYNRACRLESEPSNPSEGDTYTDCDETTYYMASHKGRRSNYNPSRSYAESWCSRSISQYGEGSCSITSYHREITYTYQCS